MAKKVAEVFIETLVSAGVKRVYGVVGDSLNGLTDVIRRSKQIEWLHVRHEEAAAFAAGADAHVTGKIAVCAGSCGPGNLHLINGLFDCHRSRVPVLAIAAQIPSHEIGSGYFQETHPDHLFKDCSYYCELVSQAGADAESAGNRHAYGHHEARRRRDRDSRGRGAARMLRTGAVARHRGFRLGSFAHRTMNFSKAAEILNNARKVTILGGAGCEGAHAELIAVAERLKAPIVHALRGQGIYRIRQPL